MDELDAGQNPLLSTREERQRARLEDHHSRSDATSAAKIRFGGQQRDEVLSALVRGKPFTYWSPDIDQLKREGRLLEALELAWECMEAAERWTLNSPFPPPGWYPRVAVICRKLRFYEREAAVLQRAIDHADPSWDMSAIRVQLDRATKRSVAGIA